MLRANVCWYIVLTISCAGAVRVPRQLLSSISHTAVATIYNGRFETGWQAWNWGLSYFNAKDAAQAMQGSRYALCIQMQPYGALSLRSSVPFPMDGTLGFYLRGANLTAGGLGLAAASRGALPLAKEGSSSLNATVPGLQLGDLELQFESSSPSTYTISRSATLSELLKAQAPTGADKDAYAQDALAAMQAGQWTAVKVRMAAFIPQGWTGKFDRVTIGPCLQRDDKCRGGEIGGTVLDSKSWRANGGLALCMDKLVIVTAS